MSDSTERISYSDFIKSHLPENRRWKSAVSAGIDFMPGISTEGVHGFAKLGRMFDTNAVIIGQTGTGKSNLLQSIIANLILQYSPEELSLWLVDFKGTEFGVFSLSENQSDIAPHIEYLDYNAYRGPTFVAFDRLRKVVEERYNLLVATKQRCVEDYNKVAEEFSLRKLKTIVVFIDEYGMLADSAVSDRTRDDLKYLEKCSRAAGVHFVLSSQSQKYPALGFFGMRPYSKGETHTNYLSIALRSDASTSVGILGSEEAADIKEPHGVALIKATTSGGKILKVKVPYISSEELQAVLHDVVRKAKLKGLAERPLIIQGRTD